MAVAQQSSYQQLRDRIEEGHRRSLLRTVVLSIATVAVAGLMLFITLRALDQANQKLDSANRQLDEVTREVRAAIAKADEAQAELTEAQTNLRSTADQTTALQAQVAALEKQLAAAQQALDEAFDLSRQVYKFDWGELKLMYMENGPAVEVLDVVQRFLGQLRWGLANTKEGGYTSPGFAKLVLQQLHRLPPNADLASLPRDDGAPNPGDIVIYASGYHLFYFRDHERRQFVVGMTPYGITALNYDFGVKRIGVLRSGFPPR
ncbi:hypothetical protein [Inquilinus limosus]|uniref:hypothetical protein n=1 Tax=Inquilinus limosus TaxID=171674 RepID=UPI00047AA614|nr:hypothetical protein [Inquilinus limosus]